MSAVLPSGSAPSNLFVDIEKGELYLADGFELEGALSAIDVSHF